MQRPALTPTDQGPRAVLRCARILPVPDMWVTPALLLEGLSPTAPMWPRVI